VPYFTLWGAFTFLYVFIPNTRVKLTSAVLGGLVAAVLWQTVGWGFTVFVAVLDSLLRNILELRDTTFVLALAARRWVIVLLGAQVAYAHQTFASMKKKESF